MATAETVELGEAHPPKQESLRVFEELQSELKHELIKLRHNHDKHEPEYFAAVRDLSDKDLAAAFAVENFKEVRVATSAYGIHIFGKVRIPSMPADGPAYIHFRLFSTGADDPAKFHAFHTEEKEEEGGGKTFRAIFTDRDPLEWFDN
ncbi:hypothetical protein MAPG_08297 [Magnaporthiopsis poae ATCC 64411]|uniref:Uncharacterized protein n=1 Tax=Magnaporthiopsis poae (strain ATCC 64411 / 73-15) TaxID=644358 RepID=A0A0C4E6Z7_MAGP6|nr:hypothetical protein MAPG_08297 [Magnaporthiopsis poae ATCC 64411]